MKKFENFCKALNNLATNSQQESYSELESAGLVKLFEICFEQTWKLLKEILESQGLNPENFATPRKIFAISYGAGILPEEEIWLEILQTRNILIHTYDAGKSSETVKLIREKYLSAFQNLKKNLETNWLA